MNYLDFLKECLLDQKLDVIGYLNLLDEYSKRLRIMLAEVDEEINEHKE